MPKTTDYWGQREQDEKAWINKNMGDDADFNKVMQKHYDHAVSEIQRDIDSEYQKYAGTSGLTMSDAVKSVSEMDVKGYSDKAAQIVADAQKLHVEKGRALTRSDFSQEVNENLRLYNATMRINRLEMLKSKIGLELTEAGMHVNADLSQNLERAYGSEITRQAGILGDTVKYGNLKDTISTVAAQTGGATFSQRIWANQAALKGQLDGLLTEAMVKGESPIKVAARLKDQVASAINNRRYVTERIARTEMARVQDKAQKNSFSEYGYDYCKWVAEPSACAECRAIAEVNDGVYKVDDAPDIPVHANCRCSKAAWYKPELTEQDMSALKSYISSDAYKFNGALRTGSEVLDQFKQTVKDLDVALTKLPRYTGIIYRSLTFWDNESQTDYIGKHNVGETVVNKAFTSFSPKVYNPDDTIREIVLKSKKARDLRNINVAEHEVLYERNSRFIVVDRYIDASTGKPTIILEEIDDEPRNE